MEADLDRANKEIDQLKTDHEIALERKDKQVWAMKGNSFQEQVLMEHSVQKPSSPIIPANYTASADGEGSQT